MKTDTWSPLAFGDAYGVYQQALYDEFDSCAFAFWDPAYPAGPPRCDFQGFFTSGDSMMVIEGFQHSYTVLPNSPLGQWSNFNEVMMVRCEQITADSIFGVPDSVRHYAVYASNQTTLLGSFSLSKNHGLVSFTPFRAYEDQQSAGQVWDLIGYDKDPISEGFSALPSKSDYMPYTVGDDLLFRHIHYSSTGSGIVEVEQYHHLEITSIDNNLGSITGVCAKYDENGFYLGTENQYTIDFDPLFQGMATHPYSIPYLENGPGNSVGNILSIPLWFESGDSGIVSKFGGYETAYCDSDMVVDGEVHRFTFSTAYGLLYRYDHASSITPETWQLYAADAQNFSYGTWPQWLGVTTWYGRGLDLYPNPASDHFSISGLKPGSVSVDIYGMQGQLLYTFSGTGLDMMEVEVSNLEAGVYSILLRNAGTTTVIPLVVQR